MRSYLREIKEEEKDKSRSRKGIKTTMQMKRKKAGLILISLMLVLTSLPVSATEAGADPDGSGQYMPVKENQKQEPEEQEADTKDESSNETVTDETDEKSEVLTEDGQKAEDTQTTEDSQKTEGVTPDESGKPSDETKDEVLDQTDRPLEREEADKDQDDSSRKDMSLTAAQTDGPREYDLSSDNIEARFKNGQTEYVYTGSQIKPEIELVAKPDPLKDSSTASEVPEKVIDADCYTAEYRDNIKTGIASIIIKGRDTTQSVQQEETNAMEEDTFTGTKTVKFKITPADIKKCEVQAPKTADYTGKQVKPKVTVSYQGKKLASGKDYKLTYSNNKKMGTASIRINGTGNFNGSRTVKFKIKFGTPVVKATSSYSKINLKWKKIKDASGYVVYRSTSKKGKFKKIYTCRSGSKVSYSDKTAKFGKTYYYKVRAFRKIKVKVKKRTQTKQEYSSWSAVVNEKRKLSAVTIKSAKCLSETTAKVTWKMTTGAQGYEIYKSTEKNGTYVYAGKVKGSGRVSYTAKKLKKGVAHYFKVRAYRKSGGKTYYGKFSAVKKESFSEGQRLYTLFPKGVPTKKAEMEKYLVTITVPIKDEEGVPSTTQLRVHKDLAKKFMKAFQEMYAIGFPVRAEDTDTYNWRNMSSGKNRSHHSYGCVVDLNWNSNPMIGVTEGEYSPGVDPYSITPEVVAIWKKQGFYWGGNWKSSKDYMHFTYTNH